MKVKTKYKTSASGRGQIVATATDMGRRTQYTHNYDPLYGSETNHGHAAGILIDTKWPGVRSCIVDEGYNVTHDSNDAGTEHVFTV